MVNIFNDPRNQPIPVKRRKVVNEAQPFQWDAININDLVAERQVVFAQGLNPGRNIAEPPQEPRFEDPDENFVHGLFEDEPRKPPERKPMKVRADYSSRAFSTKSTRLPAFRMAYQGQEEMQLRLQGTVIQSHDTTLYVHRIEVVQCDFSGAVGLGAKCLFPDGSHRGVLFNAERTNLRSPEPGYIQLGSKAVFYHRVPARVYKQGINHENAYFYATNGQRMSVFGHYPQDDILTSFDERPIIQWQDVWPDGYESYRLSDRVALNKVNKSIHVYYKNRQIGYVKGRNVLLKQDVEKDFWMARAMAAVGFAEIITKA